MAFQTWMYTAVFFLMCMDSIADDSPIRLYGGSSDNNGFVQVNVTGVWKTICNDGWDAVDALVACRQLGLTDGYAMLFEDHDTSQDYYYDTAVLRSHPLQNHSKENFPIEGNEFACTGSEESLLSCKYTKHRTYCSTLAGVACGITEAKFTELLDGLSGRFYYGGSFTFSATTSNVKSGGQILIKESYRYGNEENILLAGGVCDLDEQAAMMICDKHGYTYGGKPTRFPTIENLPMVISGLTCNGAEQLYECSEMLTIDGVCPDGVQNNGVECYTTLRPSVIGSLTFAGVASIIILIAGVCSICLVRRQSKNPPATSINLTVNGSDDFAPGQTVPQTYT